MSASRRGWVWSTSGGRGSTAYVPTPHSQARSLSTPWSPSVRDAGHHVTPEDISQRPVIIYLPLGIPAAIMIVNAFPKIHGTLCKALEEWSKRRREVRI